MTANNATERFSSRVDNYARYRPGYPPEIISLLNTGCGLTPESVIADIASGTGIFTRLLLENGNRVYGVEPNAEMRRQGENFLASFPDFQSVAGKAEMTTLADRSIDIVTAAQAAHWFDRATARAEFVRIQKPEGWTVLLWNERQTDSTTFLREYEQLLLNYGTDYKEVRHERTTDEIAAFFAPANFQTSLFSTQQKLEYAALEGRLLSSSYTPLAGDPRYQPMLKQLRAIFDAHQQGDRVVLEYITRVYYGQLSRV